MWLSFTFTRQSRSTQKYLIHKGWVLKKVHDLEPLITEATGFDASFKKYLDLGRKSTAFYYEQRYPPCPITSNREKK
nr:hypothetical protein [Candidatus Sigynarchaeota archaeon]